MSEIPIISESILGIQQTLNSREIAKYKIVSEVGQVSPYKSDIPELSAYNFDLPSITADQNGKYTLTITKLSGGRKSRKS